ncbi:mitochondrial cardiolipin hydrolase [Acanthopagrus latus]|uniref:mitochondrial cardiolipin hydrolase n=1 Tax=Acanthopagrus latus TaxID=8177 RepID=UPI00187CE0ED|nr:mitochondrial cardiolipin hydrolase [Acanthopagrus latus]XP_036957514.1 mitochondrial cardiolipin hydrolase [Acanthopagrus latus]XP_036957522.1 mitochondrial cardiolipin hydrolase [Acanthopagrus latus]XP_036957528.1 mitochondrial cardiolipin hydrolase [Acanthopagrus latus]XP_036957536.1 mitochondrial cardiolipin hydrolase [Acanthopagrus latus]XP_036957541.1 mitochondrial cardiolipin hydrolase [Acanthopagrus latus]XP_036957549.1 mitochondrial cardiolipin hydrolase [Acanthopagrus latus]
MWTVKEVGLGVVAVALSLELIVLLVRRLKPRRTLNEVLFFPTETVCVEHIFTSSSSDTCLCSLAHGVESSFTRLLRHILSASSSLDLCIFAFSNMDLSRAVCMLHRRGVTIRVIVDKDYVAISCSQIGVLRKAGICVRCSVDSVFMHHKFSVVDGRLLITGSLNWTLSAVQGNMENILVTEEPDLVKPFIKEFHKLWAHNDPARHHRSSDQNPAHFTARA